MSVADAPLVDAGSAFGSVAIPAVGSGGSSSLLSGVPTWAVVALIGAVGLVVWLLATEDGSSTSETDSTSSFGVVA